MLAIEGLSIDLNLGLGAVDEEVDKGVLEKFPEDDVYLDNETEAVEGKSDDSGDDNDDDNAPNAPQGQAGVKDLELAGRDLTEQDRATFRFDRDVHKLKFTSKDLVASKLNKMNQAIAKRDREIAATSKEIRVGDTVFFSPDPKDFGSKTNQWKCDTLPAIVCSIKDTRYAKRKKSRQAQVGGVEESKGVEKKQRPVLTKLYTLVTLHGQLNEPQYSNRLKLVQREQRKEYALFEQLATQYQKVKKSMQNTLLGTEVAMKVLSVVDLCKAHVLMTGESESARAAKQQGRNKAVNLQMAQPLQVDGLQAGDNDTQRRPKITILTTGIPLPEEESEDDPNSAGDEAATPADQRKHKWTTLIPGDPMAWQSNTDKRGTSSKKGNERRLPGNSGIQSQQESTQENKEKAAGTQTGKQPRGKIERSHDHAGLQNLGNTCCMNAPVVCEFAFSSDQRQRKTCSGKTCKDCALKKLRYRVHGVQETHERVVNPQGTWQTLQMQGVGVQQDAMEVLERMLEAARGAYEGDWLAKLPNCQGRRPQRGSRSAAHFAAKELLMARGSACRKCEGRHKWINEQANLEQHGLWELALLPVAEDEQQQSVPKMLELFFAPYLQDGKSSYDCPNCGPGQHEQVIITQLLHKWPKKLRLNICRGAYVSGAEEDVLGNPATDTWIMTWPVDVPLEFGVPQENKLHNPTAWQEEANADKYRLKSVLVHDESSSCVHGHYWAIVRSPNQERWLLVDDHRVVVLPETWRPDGPHTMCKWQNAKGQSGMVSALFYENVMATVESDFACDFACMECTSEGLYNMWKIHLSGVRILSDF